MIWRSIRMRFMLQLTMRSTLALSLTALIFYIPAVLLPFMSIEFYGQTNSPTIWGGIKSLLESRSYVIALIIFLASLVIPFAKLVALFYLSLTAFKPEYAAFREKLFLIVDVIGRWSMLDIFLLAVLVAVVKLGRWATVQPEVGSLMFALVVIFTMLASTTFNRALKPQPRNS